MLRSMITRHPLLALSGVGILLLIPMILLSDFPQPDVFMRYAPMASAFAAGDWAHAFHPRIPPLFPLITGTLAWLGGCSGFFAVQLVSAVFFLLTLLPLHALIKRAASERIALISCAVYLLCPYFLRLGSSGLRETPKTFGFLCAIHALLLIWQERSRFRGYLYAAAAAAFMALIRDDSIGLAALLFLCALGFDLARKRIPWRSFAMGGVFLLLILPVLVITYQQTGYPAPSLRFAKLAQMVIPAYALGGVPEPDGAVDSADTDNMAYEQASDFALAASGDFPAVALTEDAQAQNCLQSFLQSITTKSVTRFVEESLRGSYLIFLALAIVVICRRIWRESWTRPETFLLLIWGGYYLVQVLQFAVFENLLYMDRRYLLPAAPLLFLWTAWGIDSFDQWLKRRFGPGTGRRLALLAGIVVAAGLYLDAVSPRIQARFIAKYASKREAVKRWAARIRADYRGPDHASGGKPSIDIYHSGKLPLVVCGALPELGYFAGGESIMLAPEQSLLFQSCRVDYAAAAIAPDQAVPVFTGYELLELYTCQNYRFGLWKRIVPADTPGTSGSL